MMMLVVRLKVNKYMSKAFLIMDMPDCCLDCQFCREIDEAIEACCEIMDEPYDSSLCRMIEDYCQCRPSWCPLKELPAKMKYSNGTYNGEVKGWNLCLEEILNENKSNES